METKHATPGYSSNQADHLARLRKIEGQVRGLHRMVDEEQYCIDVLTQIASVTKALQSLAVRLLDEVGRAVVAAVAGDLGGLEGLGDLLGMHLDDLPGAPPVAQLQLTLLPLWYACAMSVMVVPASARCPTSALPKIRSRRPSWSGTPSASPR